jgi:hypothetical protein
MDVFNMAIMIPFPGTKVQQMAKQGKAGYRLLTEDWSQYTKQRGGPLELTYLSLAELRRIQARSYWWFYFRPRKIAYILRTIPLKKIAVIILDLFRRM